MYFICDANPLKLVNWQFVQTSESDSLERLVKTMFGLYEQLKYLIESGNAGIVSIKLFEHINRFNEFEMLGLT